MTTDNNAGVDGDGEVDGEPSVDDLMRIVDEKYEGDPSRLILASKSIKFDRIADIYNALKELGQREDMKIVDFVDTFVEPKKSGYGDIRVKVRMSNDQVAEFRLQLASVERVTDTERALYEVRRDLKRRAEDERRDLTPREEALDAELATRVAEEYRQATEEGRR